MGMKSSSGLFKGTKGAKQHSVDNAPIKKAGDLRYSKKKTEGYLLNLDHPKGGSKAKFMKEVLGYDKTDSKLFHKNIVSAIIGKKPTKTTETKFGLKHQYDVKLIGKGGKSVKANVVVVVQKDNGRRTYKIVTVHPGEKEN